VFLCRRVEVRAINLAGRKDADEVDESSDYRFCRVVSWEVSDGVERKGLPEKSTFSFGQVKRCSWWGADRLDMSKGEVQDDGLNETGG